MLGNDEISEDGLLGGRVRLAQPKSGYRAGIDPVLLAAAVPAISGDTVLDVGAGAGAAALCLAVRVPDVAITGIEADDALVSLANRNAVANGLDGRVEFVMGDILTPPAELVASSPFDHVMTNPPFHPKGVGQHPTRPRKAEATVESSAELRDWLRFCLRMARDNGTVTIIHRADRLDAILEGLAGRLGRLVIFPFWPGPDATKPAKRIIVTGRKGSHAPLALLPGLVLHESDGRYTYAAERVLRGAEPLSALDCGRLRSS